MQLVFLSPDAEEVLIELDQDSVYVVGGIVDRTVRKGITSSFAVRMQSGSTRRMAVQCATLAASMPILAPVELSDSIQ
jgi:tRNA (guanine9-N1)-methyltransferase